MSLNWKEINIILDELSLKGKYIQQVFQTDYRNIYFQLFLPRQSFYLRICLEQGISRLHKTTSRPRSQGWQPRFSEFLRSRIKGGTIEEVSQIGPERIVCFTIRRNGNVTLLYTKLWGNAANIIVCDQDQYILEAAYRRPARGEVAGNIFSIARSDDKQICKLMSLSIRPCQEGKDFNQSIADEYTEQERKQQHKRLLKEVRNYYLVKKNSLTTRIIRIEKRKKDSEQVEKCKEYADAILSQAWRISVYEKVLTVENPHKPGESIHIPLDNKLSPAKNAEMYYNKARKLKNSCTMLIDEHLNISTILCQVRQRLKLLNETISLTTLSKIYQEIQEERRESRGNSLKEGQPGLNYFSQGFHILVGRNAKENDTILRRSTRGNDIWLHTRNYSGSYVFIKQRRGKSVPLDILLDAGNLALHFSKARNNGSADIYYTQVKYLRRPKKGKMGLVLPTQEKSLFIRADEKRLERLLHNSGETSATH